MNLDGLSVANFYLRITNDEYYSKGFSHIKWAENSLSDMKNNIKIYLELDSEKGQIKDLQLETFIKFDNSKKIKELVIRDVAANKLTDVSVWNAKFQLDDPKKIFLV